MPRYNPRARKRRQHATRSRVITTFGGRRREMQHREGRSLQPTQRAVVVQVGNQRNDALRAKLAHIAAFTRVSDEMRAVAQALRDAQRNVAAPYQEHALHRASGAPKAPVKRGQAHTSRDPVQEPSMSKPTQSR
jgi:hypothetical protein